MESTIENNNNLEPSTQKRFHELDTLRAIMMQLGIVLHAATFYMITPVKGFQGLHDPESLFLFDIIKSLITLFRMPLFFLISGFFGALLFKRKGFSFMVKNRLNRIALPFTVFLPLTYPILRISFHLIINPQSSGANDTESVLSLLWPPRVYHLWFLYYLIAFYIAAISLNLIYCKLFSSSTQLKLNNLFLFFSENTTGHMAIPIAITTGLNIFWALVDAPLAFKTSSYYFTTFLLGWVLYKNQKTLYQLTSFPWDKVAVGTTSFFIFLAVSYHDSNSFPYILVQELTAAIATWNMLWGILGLFQRYLSSPSKAGRYFSDASYWIYLIHYPIVALLSLSLLHVQIGAVLKFIIVVSVTALSTLVSYHCFVRSTFIGQFLNGRKFPKEEFPISYHPKSRNNTKDSESPSQHKLA
ncbi:acyltransferase family protein [Flammeovirgaceae bacterium SG7u.111]|nr:acyltransferase family protein [Flammeovirgaceae bacterium SG7u.132]WPO37004.1 acyltransferase family protein [Flammeovirgaceae bacterium SG7u.111]